ncbi:MAG: ATP:cob(I)alamin adenosyltransferase, partial [Robiginitalea sp.]|nr:ATP:cob(I)alamin adenosyltransferase [Robiginitalea sp.]
RLSDYLFVLARKLSSELQADEIKWVPRDKKE